MDNKRKRHFQPEADLSYLDYQEPRDAAAYPPNSTPDDRFAYPIDPSLAQPSLTPQAFAPPPSSVSFENSLPYLASDNSQLMPELNTRNGSFPAPGNGAPYMPPEPDLLRLLHDELPSSPMSQTMLSPPYVGPSQHQRLPKEGFTQEQDQLLVDRRKEGQGYARIVDEFFTKFGVVRTENCLAKRFSKIQDQYLEPLPEAVKRAMPAIMTCIQAQMTEMGIHNTTGMEKHLTDLVLRDVPQNFVKGVQTSLYSRRKALLNTFPKRT